MPAPPQGSQTGQLFEIVKHRTTSDQNCQLPAQYRKARVFKPLFSLKTNNYTDCRRSFAGRGSKHPTGCDHPRPDRGRSLRGSVDRNATETALPIAAIVAPSRGDDGSAALRAGRDDLASRSLRGRRGSNAGDLVLMPQGNGSLLRGNVDQNSPRSKWRSAPFQRRSFAGVDRKLGRGGIGRT